MKEIKSLDGKTVVVTNLQFDVINSLKKCRRGGMATVHGYKPSTDIIEQPIYDINMITKFSVLKTYERKIEALQGVSFEDVAELSENDEKLKELTGSKLLDVFNKRKAQEIASMTKTLDGIRDDNHRKAHDTYYAHFDSGIKANIVELKDGKYAIKSIMIQYLELNRTTVKEGSYKTVNSGCPVRMGKIFNKLTNQKSHGLKTLSLKEDNFKSFRIDRQELKPSLMESFGQYL